MKVILQFQTIIHFDFCVRSISICRILNSFNYLLKASSSIGHIISTIAFSKDTVLIVTEFGVKVHTFTETLLTMQRGSAAGSAFTIDNAFHNRRAPAV